MAENKVKSGDRPGNRKKSGFGKHANENIELSPSAFNSDPKGWKSYLREFLMLFLAVFCGFLAQYFLEHKIEREQGRDFAVSFREDMIKDTAILQKNITDLRKFYSSSDSLARLISNGRTKTKEEIKKLYEFNLSALSGFTINLTDRTSAQLKSGGMRLITNKKVADAIVGYWDNMGLVEGIDGGAQTMRMQAREKSYLIFDQKYYSDSINANGVRLVADGAVLMTNDYVQLAEFANRVSHIKNLVKGRLINSLEDQKALAIEIIKLISEEYKIG
jgi:hypothetical protein